MTTLLSVGQRNLLTYGCMSKPWVLLFCLAAASAHAQAKPPVSTDLAPPPSSRFPASWYPADNDITNTSAPQRGSPYSATLITTWQLRDPNGNTRPLSNSTFQARDAAGRKRDEVEMPRPDGHGGVIKAHEVSIGDPVSHCSFRWMEPWVATGPPTATVTCMPRTVHFTPQNIYADELSNAPQDRNSFPGVTDRSEPLGTRRIEDLDATGVRHTRTRTEAQSGKTTVLITEIWYSSQLQELLEMRLTESPGTQPENSPLPNYKLTEIHRGDPDEKLFYPPDGYKIESGN
jgi:hypothetical protein